MTDKPADALPRRTGRGRPKGVRNKVTRDLRESVLQSFYMIGDRQWLARLARTHPAVYATILTKVIPTETKVSVLGSYTAIPVPVEVRDSLPAIAASNAAVDAIYDAITGEHTVPDHVPAEPEADWLDS